MGEHTSGPWHVEDPLGTDAGDALWIVQEGASPEVYDWRCVAIVTSDDPEETDNPIPVTAPERDANARLIAAAPDLLEACRVAASLCVGTFAEGGTPHKQMLAAIALATGTQP